ncbi:hypothetical protein MM817_01300 [Acidibacillus sp. S0AB]|uniref:Uncharacterized protein n=1 Tax=Sulfoacidibacillus ferrooxidans TaxID=2005001 RepID=A0A9X1V879_9BACL|nr:hypothetical protein [Sulfoacidibacillus ferrooxidans]
MKMIRVSSDYGSLQATPYKLLSGALQFEEGLVYE